MKRPDPFLPLITILAQVVVGEFCDEIEKGPLPEFYEDDHAELERRGVNQ
ncbi:MAG TPA: hypothetical protein VGQ08_17025 [Nitrospiraceae bacterium]|jgi:hypothetical protein|nr:hypothetical protein [Nitrospiraceae bacterium]